MADPIEVAEREYRQAQEAERRLQEAIVGGDESITAEDLAAAEVGVRHAALRVQAAMRLADEKEARRRARREAQRQAERQVIRDRDRATEREGWLRAIESGEAARHVAYLRRANGARPRFKPEYEALLIEHGILDPVPT